MPKAVTHPCRWPGCHRKVGLKLWGCKPHWFALPASIRTRIWDSYRPGQEHDLKPSAQWVEADQEAREYAAGTFRPRPDSGQNLLPGIQP